MHRVELAKRAQKDLRKLPARISTKLLDVLEDELAADPRPDNLDVKPLEGHPGWLRVRHGNHRILCRPLTTLELSELAADEDTGFLVARVVDRRELERAAAGLPKLTG